MQTSTIRDFILVLKSLSTESIETDQYLKRYKPSRWSKGKTSIYLKVLNKFGLIKSNSLISITKTGKDIISSVEKEKIIFINTFFKLLKDFKPLNVLTDELKTYFLINPKLSIKKLVNKSKETRKLGIVGQYFVSILFSSFFLYNELPRKEKYFELIAKSFMNSFIDKKGISFQKLIDIATTFQVNVKNIKVELLKKWRKYYLIKFPIEIKQILIKIIQIHVLDSLPFLINLDFMDLTFIKESVKKYPQMLQFVKFSKDTDKMKLKITEEIFSNNLIISLK